MSKHALKVQRLSRCRDLTRENERILAEIERWREIGSRMTTSFSQAGLSRGGVAGGRVARAAANIADLERRLDQEIQSNIRARDEIMLSIERVERAKLRLLLKYRYINGYTFEKIAVEMDISWNWAHRLHSMALEVIEI